MPKPTTYTVCWLPEQGYYALREQGHEDRPLPPADDTLWREWLAQTASFAFWGQHGHLSLLKEARARGEGYWYAYQRIEGRKVKKYAGRGSDLTIPSLEAIAKELHTGQQTLKDIGAFKDSGYDASLHDKEESGEPYQALLLAPKLRLPRLHTALVKRERLLAQLDGGLERKLTLLSAPAGFGKTTLVRQWIEERVRKLPVAWVSLDGGDNDPARFWRYVMSACEVFRPGLSQSALELLHTVEQLPFKTALLEAVLTTFLNELTSPAYGYGAARNTRGVLVLEDYHVITQPQLHEAMAFFLDHLPTSLHIIIITRVDPPLPLLRLHANNNLCELHAPDLRFSQEETAAFLQQTTALDLNTLTPETLRQVDTEMEGWAVGLRLLAFALQGQTDQQAILASLAHNRAAHRPIQAYFVAEVLNAQPEPLQRFLLLTSVLNRLTASLCNAVVERDDSEQNLRELERANLFLEMLDSAGEWYRYHALFAESMQQEARRRYGAEALQSALQRASCWYEQQQMPPDAIEMALQARDMERGAQLIERITEKRLFVVSSPDIHEIQEFYTMRRWLQQLPATVISQHPLLCLYYAISLIYLFVAGHPADPQAVVTQIETLLHLAEEFWRREQNRGRLGEIFAFRSIIARQRKEMQVAITWARQALEYLPDGEIIWRGVSLGTIGMGEVLEGQLDRAQDALGEAYTLNEPTGNRPFIRTLLGMLSSVYYEQGKLYLTDERLRHMLAQAREQPDMDDIGHAQLGLAALAYEWNDLSAARQKAEEVLELGQHIPNEEFEALAMILLAQVQHAQGQTTLALQQLAHLLTRMSGVSPQTSVQRFWHYRQVLFMQARLQLASGDLLAVQRWSGNRAQYETLTPLVDRLHEELLIARWLHVQGREEESLDLLARLLKIAQQTKREYMELRIQALMVPVLTDCKRVQEARQLLLAMVARTHVQGYIRLFLDEGTPMLNLLRSLLPQIREKLLLNYLQTVLLAFDQGQRPGQPSSTLRQQLLPDPLSPQELRVLRLLVAGRSNAEIASELVVSINTIRTQVSSIYRKLAVSGRFEASAVARNLGIVTD